MSPTRRAILAATAPIAADMALAPFVRPAQALAVPANPDVALLALREPYEQTLAAMNREADVHSVFETTFYDRVRADERVDREALTREIGLDVEEAKYEAAVQANTDVIHKVAVTPARTLEGLRFKAMVSSQANNSDLDLVDAIINDLLMMTPGP